ncbi:MAG: polyprenyl synthetase family protein [Cyanobacteria bacterium P01_F01_bin.56]
MDTRINVEEEIRCRTQGVVKRLDELHFKDAEHNKMLRYAVAGGKRLRPALVVLGSEIVGGCSERVTDAAAAVELLHKFTLIHDDIVDHDDYRRGRRSFHTVFGVERGIIFGDLLISRAYELIEGLEQAYSAKTVLQCSRILNNTLRNLCSGELLDISSEDSSAISMEQYLAAIAGKTASLTESSLKIGAILGGGSAEMVQKLGECGHLLGLAFQIRNDLNDILYPKLNDQRERAKQFLQKKNNYLTVKLYEIIDAESINLLEKEKSDIASLRSFFERNGIIKECFSILNELVFKMNCTIESISGESYSKAVLQSIGVYIQNESYWQSPTCNTSSANVEDAEVEYLETSCSKEIYALVKSAKAFYDKNRVAHGWWHIERVFINARVIASTEKGVDLNILDAMVILHDIVRHEDERESDSIPDTIALAEKILAEQSFSSNFIEHVTQGIISHTIHGSERISPASIEAKILFDADKLEGLGLIGAARWLMLMSNKNLLPTTSIEKYLATIKRETRKNSPLFTDEGNRLLEQRLQKGVNFFNDLLQELNGISPDSFSSGSSVM